MASYNGHDYIEIGGSKWATMNVGASSITDTGLYFQWGDTHGYTSALVGPNTTAYKKPFNWGDYKFSGGRTSPGSTGMTKYNRTDGKLVLDGCDDAARANWGGSWRIPTTEEFQDLSDAVTTAWTTSYQGSGVAGLICTAKNGSGAQLFFPDASSYYNASSVGHASRYWSSTRDEDNYAGDAYNLYLDGGYLDWVSIDPRYYGCPVRGVVGT